MAPGAEAAASPSARSANVRDAGHALPLRHHREIKHGDVLTDMCIAVLFYPLALVQHEKESAAARRHTTGLGKEAEEKEGGRASVGLLPVLSFLIQASRPPRDVVPDGVNPREA